MLCFFVLSLFICAACGAPMSTAKSFSAPYGNRRTAYAVLYEENGIWGSVIFHQWEKNTPVIMSLLFTNIKSRGAQMIDYAIHDEPVHYDMYNRSQICSAKALRSVVRLNNEDVGNLAKRHRPMRGSRFSEVVYDKKLSLFEDSPGNIVGKSFVVRQGDSEAEHQCATIYLSRLESQRPGAVPCEFATYSDCLVGAVNSNDTCVFNACFGFRQYWGTVDENTLMCKQVTMNYPKATVPIVERKGVVPCAYGNYSLLKPMEIDSEL